MNIAVYNNYLAGLYLDINPKASKCGNLVAGRRLRTTNDRRLATGDKNK